MRDEPAPLADGRLLDAWEAAGELAPVGRPIALLAEAYRRDFGWLADQPLGRRDALLVRLRRALAGDRLDAVAACPGCGEAVELEFSLGTLWEDDGPEPAGDGPDGSRELTVTTGRYEVRCRPVTTADLAAVRTAPDRARALLERCVPHARRAGEPVPPADLPDEVRAAVEEALVAADPHAETLLGLRCPACDTQWWAGLDLAAFLWADVERLAMRTLREVDTLARAYGWRESDILAMGRTRRRRYLDLVTA
ncbi:hypothetical protein [Streptomyces pseudogriseolus]|uniref:hypothetical protein n=1 Tax=Streptomyces pseudogriseolus TaxID=36817 RepID=UPI003FA32FD1